jgi:hypothetical protein
VCTTYANSMVPQCKHQVTQCGIVMPCLLALWAVYKVSQDQNTCVSSARPKCLWMQCLSKTAMGLRHIHKDMAIHTQDMAIPCVHDAPCTFQLRFHPCANTNCLQHNSDNATTHATQHTHLCKHRCPSPMHDRLCVSTHKSLPQPSTSEHHSASFPPSYECIMHCQSLTLSFTHPSPCPSDSTAFK